MKLISILFFALLAGTFSRTAASAPKFSGKCAKQAVEAAVAKWADVPNPDPNLEYLPVSSNPTKPGGEVYTVVLAFSDGNDIIQGRYEVVFGDYQNCRKPRVTTAK